jgi:hypothetical protein
MPNVTVRANDPTHGVVVKLADAELVLVERHPDGLMVIRAWAGGLDPVFEMALAAP